ncbi:hypothetical protein RFI_07079 [Reticulomyxa filosa]|uniref:Uncharacterized protein n=1 Tax=Reticulomyxa filosa TaxID=46433 RepID=X6NVK3_RETFI|nr:hypothetical protein RFI_07079 [Reticulomyxa filosa]|eukprot:ETO30041.1 hypothetical protein RFI_07079 [Reticulomyxa filosa]
MSFVLTLLLSLKKQRDTEEEEDTGDCAMTETKQGNKRVLTQQLTICPNETNEQEQEEEHELEIEQEQEHDEKERTEPEQNQQSNICDNSNHVSDITIDNSNAFCFNDESDSLSLPPKKKRRIALNKLNIVKFITIFYYYVFPFLVNFCFIVNCPFVLLKNNVIHDQSIKEMFVPFCHHS